MIHKRAAGNGRGRRFTANGPAVLLLQPGSASVYAEWEMERVNWRAGQEEVAGGNESGRWKDKGCGCRERGAEMRK